MTEEGKTHRDPALERIIERVSTEHGFDVRGYKRSTLYRRLRRRMSDAGCANVEDYLVRLETDRHEYPQLVNTILINVTEFFRDPEAWDFLRDECLAPLIRDRGPGEPVRAWSVGCASGEEAYSLAITLADLLGERSLRDVKIYATDLDDAALAQARAGIYRAEDLKNLSRQRQERYLDELPGGRFGVRRELRSAVIFGRHNIMADPPISRLDVLVCRNLLIYFDNDTQHQLLARFHYALRPQGFLFLGKAETLLSRSMLFRPVEPRFRIFQRAPHAGPTDGLTAAVEARRLPAVMRTPAGDQVAQNQALHAVIDQVAEAT